ncbi:MAG: hypothetical protein IJ570_07580 [Prevotella sp.]|nr:hypothetical protein [Prevotella sp.]
MKQENIELDEMRQQMTILKDKLDTEEMDTDEMVRTALNDYAKKAYGSVLSRILFYLSISSVVIWLTWMSYETIVAVAVAVCILLGLGFIAYLKGVFSPIEAIVNNDLMHAGVAEIREYDHMRQKPWFRIVSILIFTIIYVVGYVILSYKELQAGEESIWRISLQGLATGIIVELIREYYYRRNEKKLLQRLDELEDGGE